MPSVAVSFDGLALLVTRAQQVADDATASYTALRRLTGEVSAGLAGASMPSVTAAWAGAAPALELLAREGALAAATFTEGLRQAAGRYSATEWGLARALQA